MIGQDRYKVGDKVKFTYEYPYQFENDIEYTVEKIIDVTREYRSVGHTQWLILVEKKDGPISGLWFVPK